LPPLAACMALARAGTASCASESKKPRAKKLDSSPAKRDVSRRADRFIWLNWQPFC
jgi:hypothetical protein